MEEISIKKLNQEKLSEAIKLVEEIFPGYENPKPRDSLKASVDSEYFKEFNQSFDNQAITIEYFIASNINENIVGITGIYTIKENYKDTCRLGWYGVSKKFRGKGIGKKILNFSVEEAKKRGYKYLKLYTSTYENEKEAQIIYEKNGFFITNDEKIQKEGYEIFYRMKNLKE